MPRPIRPRTLGAAALPLVLLAAGCAVGPADEPKTGAVTTSANPVTTSATTTAPTAPAPTLRPVIGETTQQILDYQEHVKNNPGQGQVSDLKITATDPITLSGNAYVSAIGKISVDQIKYNLEMFNALEGRYPEDYDEFMERIIRATNIALPQLPGYQEYAYDAPTHQLLVLEFPERKEALRQQVNGQAGP